MTENNLTLGSLFDGSGGFPLAGVILGIKPVWASEIEPFPIRVTTKRLPEMKHYGDISSMDGGKIEPVDIISLGSPCQDMSVAGKRAGLDGSRSSLFYEAIRIVKEMRCATNGKYPRYIVWENVPGAFSSNKGEDFRCVLESICKAKDERLSVPRHEKWLSSGEIVGDNFSLAWRVLDAQFWGVPQRRKRIFLVADFGGESAGKILFESEGLSGYSQASISSWKRTAGSITPCTIAAGCDGYNLNLTGNVSSTLGVNCGMSTGRNGVVLNDQGGNRMDITNDVTCTLRAEAHHPPCVMEAAGFCTEHSSQSRSIGYEDERSPTLRAGVVPAALAIENHPTDSRIRITEGDAVQTLTSRMGTGGNNVPLLMKIRAGCEGGGKGPLIQDDKSATLSCNNDQVAFVPKAKAFGICSKDSNAMHSQNPHSGIYEAETARTIDANGGNPGCNQGGIAVVTVHCIDQGGGKSSCNFYEEQAPTLTCTHGGEPVISVQGSMIGRKDENGPMGSGVNEDLSFTLNATDKHAVAYGIDRAAFNQGKNALYDFAVEKEMQPTMVAKGPGAVYTSSKASFFTNAMEEVAGTLVATDFKDPPLINEKEYSVRRLTPTECARLQGFPDWWCADLGIENPDMDDIRYWYDVFETHRKITSPETKSKSIKQIIKWLQNPHSDSAEYKMWGNGVALPCVVFVLAGIVWSTRTQ